MKLAVGDDALAAVFAKPDEGSTIATIGVGVAVKGVHRDVRFRAHKPLMMDAIPLENLGPGLCPLEMQRVVSPELFGIVEGTLALASEVLLQAVLRNALGRRVF